MREEPTAKLPREPGESARSSRSGLTCFVCDGPERVPIGFCYRLQYSFSTCAQSLEPATDLQLFANNERQGGGLAGGQREETRS